MNARKVNTVKGQTLLRQRNVSVVIEKIYSDGPITNRDIVNSTSISFAKVNTITTTLSKIGLIVQDGKEESIGGRRSALYNINHNFRYSIGCQLSHTRIHTCICNLKGEPIFYEAIPYNKENGKDSVLKMLIEAIEQLIKKAKIPRDKYLGIGLSIAGLYNPNDGSAIPFPHLVNWGVIAFKEILAKKFKMPSYILNVANAAALAEQNFGVGIGKNSILYLNIGTGLGMGIILNGKLFEGVSGSAGEFGHISVDDRGPLCECGNLGCREAIASTKAIVNQAIDLIQKGVNSSLLAMTDHDIKKLDFDIICQAAQSSDKLAYNLIDKMGQNIGEGIVTLINLFNPERIIIGGKISSAEKIVTPSIMHVVQKRALEIPRKNTEIVFSKMGSHSGTIGATVPIIDEFFRSQINTFIDEK